MTHFIDDLAQRITSLRNPVLVGLDPRREWLPTAILASEERRPAIVAEAYVSFCSEVIDVVASLVPAVKPQSAFFEALGPPGAHALSRVIDYARSKNLLVILDAKRCDIGSTAEAYADGLLGRGPSPIAEADHSENCDAPSLLADAVTVSPYLGEDSLQPFVNAAESRGCGLFILVKTSNPGGQMFQDLVADGRPIYRHVGEYVERLAHKSVGARGYGSVGAVVGATYPDQLSELRAAMPQSWFLVPGYGSQGGSAADVAGAFDGRGLGAVVNNSRGIIFAHRRPEFSERFGESRWQRATEAATLEMIAELRAGTPAGALS